MARQASEYPYVRDDMKPGDVIAFSGKGHFSEIIKWATRAPVSHVGIILKSQLLGMEADDNRYFNQIIESTSLNGFSGVSISRLSDRINTYDGEMWWLPLSDKARAKLNGTKFYDFLLHQEHKEYDMPQAVKSSLDALDEIPLFGKITHNIEDFSRFFCSELATAGLEEGGVISHINSSEVTPIDLCRFKIYKEDYHQINGEERGIKGYNTLSPEGWGE
ncbi:MAG: hypothetical protein ABFS43_07400 [Thermodesulfobacteriota bacterium]